MYKKCTIRKSLLFDQLKATRIFRKITEPYANNITYIKVGLESKNVLPGPRNND